MGQPKFPRKKYETPLHPWKEERIKSERQLIKKYGLKNHREVWKAKTYLKKYRQQARELLAKISAKDPQSKKESDQLIFHLSKLNVLPTGATLDDVLALETETILSRRLQTLVYLKGLSNTIDHARQLITHGHIAINNRKVTIPSYMVDKNEETQISYTTTRPLNEPSHPARPKTDLYQTPSQPTTTKTTEKTETHPAKTPEKPSPKPSEPQKEPKKETEQKQQPSTPPTKIEPQKEQIKEKQKEPEKQQPDPPKTPEQPKNEQKQEPEQKEKPQTQTKEPPKKKENEQ